MRNAIIFAIVLPAILGIAAYAREFDPAVDGWYFENWGETSPHCIGSCDFSWDLFREAYLGINPTHNCVEAPLDCAFYEIFKNCGEKGNCGGMSLLALALFKYGGYMGFCSPANFYTGEKSPDRADLHRAINVLQARQFSAAGIENLIDIVDANQVNDAVAAWSKAKECIAKGDYPVLSIANSALGDLAHTVIPYKAEDGPGGGYPKKLYIWDSVVPYDANPSHYNGIDNVMTIHSKNDWTYVQSPTRTYSGSGGSGAWCFAVPMSVILPKSRHPMTLDMVFNALMTVFVSGPGAAVSQVSDDKGRRLYTTDADVHALRSEFESDPSKRLKGVVRWPWYEAATPRPVAKPLPVKPKPITNLTAVVDGRRTDQAPGELYFIRRPAGSTGSINVAITGATYQATLGGGGNVIRIDATSAAKARDVITISRLGSSAQSLTIESLSAGRSLNIRQTRSDLVTNDWRGIEIKNLKLASGVPVTIDVVGNMESFVVSSRDQTVTFDADVQQRIGGRLTTKALAKVTTAPGKFTEIAPTGLRMLDKSEVRILDLQRPKAILKPAATSTVVK